MRGIDRFELIGRIASELQDRMTFSDIDVYLKGFGIPPYEGPLSFNSKRVYAKEVLADAPDAVLVQIADELNIPHSHVVHPTRKVEESRFWQPGYFRLFLSHISKFKGKTTALQKALRVYGISSFVAHVDIRPTKEWEQEIENALFSMDALAALLMTGFKASDWTDQEVGVAVGRGVPIVPVMKGLVPYGFIGKYQGFDADGKSVGEVARGIFEILLSNEKTSSRMWTAFVDTLVLANSESEASAKLDILDSLSDMPLGHLNRLRERVQEGGVVLDSPNLRERLNAVLSRFGIDPVTAVQEEADLAVSDDLPF